jgi:type II secretory pathway pseudopilin PulG
VRTPAGRGRARGFTLVESMVLLGIVVVFLSSLVGAQGHQARFVRERAREDAARRACAARLEALLADRSALAAGTRPVEVAGGPGSFLEGAAGEETVDLLEPGLYAVEVRVRWAAAGGEPRSVRLSTLVAGEGLAAGEGAR